MAGNGRDISYDRLSIPFGLLSLIIIPVRSGRGNHRGVITRES